MKLIPLTHDVSKHPELHKNLPNPDRNLFAKYAPNFEYGIDLKALICYDTF